jgi:hypothetical protein
MVAGGGSAAGSSMGGAGGAAAIGFPQVLQNLASAGFSAPQDGQAAVPPAAGAATGTATGIGSGVPVSGGGAADRSLPHSRQAVVPSGLS